MADTYKVLAQVNPVATTLVDAYTVPPATSAIISTITIANRAGTASSFRVSVAVSGVVDDPKQYIAYDTPIGANETVALTIGMTLAQTDKIRVYSTNGSMSFNIFGVEKT